MCTRIFDWLVVIVVPEATLPAWVDKQTNKQNKANPKREYKCCVKLLKPRRSTLFTQGVSDVKPCTSSGPITHLCSIKCPRNVCSSFSPGAPSSAFTGNPRRHICLDCPAAETRDGSQLHNGTESGILGPKAEPRWSESCLTAADFCVTPSPRVILMLIFAKYECVALFV